MGHRRFLPLPCRVLPATPRGRGWVLKRSVAFCFVAMPAVMLRRLLGFTAAADQSRLADGVVREAKGSCTYDSAPVTE